MTGNRNVLWIAVIGAVAVIAVAYLLGRPHPETASTPAAPPAISDIAPAGSVDAPVNSAFPNDPPLAIAVPVLPPAPDTTAAEGAPTVVPTAPASETPPAAAPPATDDTPPAAAPDRQ